MIRKKYLIRFLGLCVSIGLHNASKAETHSFTRPKKVQYAVDEAFEGNKETTNEWFKNGSPWYGILSIYEEILIKNLVSKNKKDIYIIDIGCGRGNWGHNIKKILETEYKDSNTKFHIFSLTGGKECPEYTSDQGNVVLHQLNQFKIENIDKELEKRGFNLKNKVDIIVSRWTLRHLADPFGTVDRLYDLLTPSGGKLLSNGFFFKLNESKEILGCPNYLQGSHIFANSNANALFRISSSMRDVDEFLLERNDAKPLDLPLEYIGSVERIDGYSYQCASDTVTKFRENEDKIKIKNTSIHILDKDERFCLNDDERCENLYKRLKKHGLFEKFESYKSH